MNGGLDSYIFVPLRPIPGKTHSAGRTPLKYIVNMQKWLWVYGHMVSKCNEVGPTIDIYANKTNVQAIPLGAMVYSNI